MYDLVILHLSDLHFTGGKKSEVLKNLPKDAKQQLENVNGKKVIVAITGDLLFQGNNAGLKNAKSFFDSLFKEIGEKIVDVLIVPGNHDKFRTDDDKLLIPAYRGFMDSYASYATFGKWKESIAKNDEKWGDFDKDSFERMFSLQLQSYEQTGYRELVEYIYSKYTHSSQLDNIASRTYGVYSVEIDSQKYCFVLLNTAWSCMGKNDNRHLLLGKFQLSDIKAQYDELVEDEEYSLSFALGHHPLESLYGTEQDALFERLAKVSGMGINAYLCGHVHDRNIINRSDKFQNIHTLITGIGWPGSTQDNYYSVYFFNTKLNTMDIVVRTTCDDGSFLNDFRLYTDKRADDSIISRPIIQKPSLGELELSTGKSVLPARFFANGQILSNLLDFNGKIQNFIVGAKSRINDAMVDLIDEINSYNEDLDCDGNDVEEDGYVQVDSLQITEKEFDWLINYFGDNLFFYNDDEKIRNKNSKKIHAIFPDDKLFSVFESFLEGLLATFHSSFFTERENEVVRVHIRYLADRNSMTYSNLCTSYGGKRIEDGYELKDKKYGDLCEAAFNLTDKPRCLIYSHNSGLCEKKKSDKWANYITIIPDFVGNVYTKERPQGKKMHAPYLSAGVAITSLEDEETLRFMNFCSIDKILGNEIQHAVNVFGISIEEFCTWIKETWKAENR